MEGRTILVQGSIRRYSVYRPASLRRFPPAVLMLPGRGMTKEQAAEQFRWIELADQQQFIVAFPQALPIVPDLALGAPLPATLPAWFGSRNDTLWWDSQYSRSFPFVHHSDDGAFIVNLIARVLTDEKADPNAVFVASFSSGGRMVADLAGQHPTSARAFACVAAIGTAMGGLRPQRLAQPVTLLLFAGDSDHTVVQDKVWQQIPRDQKLKWFGQETLPTLSSEAAAWAALDHCSASTTESIQPGQRTVWNGCLEEAHVEAYLIHDLGHEWPGASVSRWNEAHEPQPGLDLTELIWRFFVGSEISKRMT
jgi:poly(3-hydroxybutyrate) depolymerase